MASAPEENERTAILTGAGTDGGQRFTSSQRNAALDQLPAAPSTLEEVGLPVAFLEDLILKLLLRSSRVSTADVATELCLRRTIIDGALQQLKTEGYCEVAPGSAQNFTFRLSDAGRKRAEEAAEMSRYIGPAPVPIDQYVAIISKMPRRREHMRRERIREAISHLVLDEALIHAVGLAVQSGRPAIIYGASGNGKTEILTSLAGGVSERVILPAALFVAGHVIRVYDPRVHRAIEPEREAAPGNGASHVLAGRREQLDNRWLVVARPVIIVGGEFSLADMEFRHDAVDRVYVAPVSVQAQGGTIVIDDFGRQQQTPAQILDRWIVPLERGFDTLSMQAAGFVTIPFRVSLLLSTNLEPASVLEEAHLRRIPYKIAVTDPTPQQFSEVLRRVCRQTGIEYSDTAAQHMMRRLRDQGFGIRACVPRDVVQIIVDAAEYEGSVPELAPALIDRALGLYLSHVPRGEPVTNATMAPFSYDRRRAS